MSVRRARGRRHRRTSEHALGIITPLGERGRHEEGRPLGAVRVRVWGGIAVASGVAALAGFVVFAGTSADVVAATTAVAAGAILVMLADTMMPEAFEQAHDFAGLITVAGFLAAFSLSKLGA